jgi:hypothetical protein
MAMITRIASLVLLTAAVLLPAACNGGDEDGRPDAGGARRDSLSQLFVTNPSEALGRSARNFAEQVQSVQGTLSGVFSAGDVQFSMDGRFAFEGRRGYMTMGMDLGGADMPSGFAGLFSFEFLIDGDTIYVNIPFFGGWYVTTFGELGIDAETYRKFQEQKGPINYVEMVEAFGKAENLGDQKINGETYIHLRVETSASDLMAALAEALGDDTEVDFSTLTETIEGPLTLELWADPESGLPRRMQAEGALDIRAGEFAEDGFDLNGPVSFSFVTDYEKYNEPVDIPEPPSDAQPFSDVFGGFGFDEGDWDFEEPDFEDWDEADWEEFWNSFEFEYEETAEGH